MGTCCGAHLDDKVEDYSTEASNGEVTIYPFKGDKSVTCDYCKAPAKWVVSYGG